MQNTNHLLMIRPVHFTYNEQTAANNAFQVAGNAQQAQEKALEEFDAFVIKLRAAGVDVTVVNDTPQPHTPDSIFPNNWISFHSDGSIFLYPMYAPNRRSERKPHVLEALQKKFTIVKTIDLTVFEEKNKFLEGTGSMVLDRDKRITYACISPRTDESLLKKFCEQAGFALCLFHAVDMNGQDIYHTNVMMCVADKYAVICIDSIHDANEKKLAKETIENSGKEIIEISFAQMNSFAGNMLQVMNDKSEPLLIMSSQAYSSLTNQQVEKLESYNRIIHSSLNTIETNGGGSARCMMAEVFLPLKEN
ncbi:MAG TPA: arginine deiminase-related protein [Chitinophagaceae bacterium]|nr:arginine deiminase-related protein [Chitinophagaceae bacterium]